MKNILIAFALLVSVGFTAGCSNTAEKQPAVTESTTDQPEMKATTEQLAYICPMKCEGSASASPGKCSVCGMDLVMNPDHKPATDTTAQVN